MRYFDKSTTVMGISFTWKNNPIEVHKANFEVYDRVIKRKKNSIHYGKMFFLENSAELNRRLTFTTEIGSTGSEIKKVITRDLKELRKLIKEVNGENYEIFNNCFSDKWIW